MKNLLKAISYKKKYGKVAGQLVEMLAEKNELQEEIKELKYRIISLELEAKRQQEIALNTRNAAILIEARNQQLEKRNKELRNENIKLQFRNSCIERKEVAGCV